jgi:hypothetical protein
VRKFGITLTRAFAQKVKRYLNTKCARPLFTVLTTENHYVDVPMIIARLPIVTMMV